MKRKKKTPPPEHVPVRSYRVGTNVLQFLWDFPMCAVAEHTEIIMIRMLNDPENGIPTLFGAN